MTTPKEMGVRRRKGTTSMFPYTKCTPSFISLGNRFSWPMRRMYHSEGLTRCGDLKSIEIPTNTVDITEIGGIPKMSVGS